MTEQLRQLIANDAYAMTFQSLGQYRSALLAAIAQQAAQEPQPVGYFHRHRYGNTDIIEQVVDSAAGDEGVFPLYAAAPAKPAKPAEQEKACAACGDAGTDPLSGSQCVPGRPCLPVEQQAPSTAAQEQAGDEDGGDQGYSRISDGCNACLLDEWKGGRRVRAAIEPRDGFYRCINCGGSYGPVVTEGSKPGADERLHTFLDTAAGEGFVLGGIDAGDLYADIFPERYAAALAHKGAQGEKA